MNLVVFLQYSLKFKYNFAIFMLWIHGLDQFVIAGCFITAVLNHYHIHGITMLYFRENHGMALSGNIIVLFMFNVKIIV